MSYCEYFNRTNHTFWQEMVIYDYFQKMGLVGEKRSFKDWARSAEWALYYDKVDNA